MEPNIQSADFNEQITQAEYLTQQLITKEEFEAKVDDIPTFIKALRSSSRGMLADELSELLKINNA